MGRPKKSLEHKKETTRIRNARNYQKLKEAKLFYDMVKKNLNGNTEKTVIDNADKATEETKSEN